MLLHVQNNCEQCFFSIQMWLNPLCNNLHLVEHSRRRHNAIWKGTKQNCKWESLEIKCKITLHNNPAWMGPNLTIFIHSWFEAWWGHNTRGHLKTLFFFLNTKKYCHALQCQHIQPSLSTHLKIHSHLVLRTLILSPLTPS